MFRHVFSLFLCLPVYLRLPFSVGLFLFVLLSACLSIFKMDLPIVSSLSIDIDAVGSICHEYSFFYAFLFVCSLFRVWRITFYIKKSSRPSPVSCQNKLLLVNNLTKLPSFQRNSLYICLFKFSLFVYRLGPHTVLTFIVLEQMNRLYKVNVLGQKDAKGGGL